MQNNLFRKKLVSCAIALFIGICVVPSMGHASFGFGSSILCVGGNGPGNYTSIQEAIIDATNGSTIFVYNGTYAENVIINKEVTLRGEHRNSTVIDGKGQGNTVHIQSEHVILNGFTITNSSRTQWFDAGIRITASNNTIHGNNVCYNMLGIFGKQVTNIAIYDNTFISDGVTFSLYDNETEPTPFCDTYFMHTIYNNTINGKKLYYYKNQQDVIVPGDAGQIIAVNCNKITIRDANLDNADYGCILVNCSDCVIEYSSISYSDGMLWLIHSMKNLIQKNKIAHNFEGICIDCGSAQNIVQYNTITNNQLLGIIVESNSNYNTIYKNNFVNNNLANKHQQVYFSFCYFNKWRGNYWGRPKLLPKAIFGTTKLGITLFPLVNFDMRPALKPYALESCT
jgi:nitrous oxidase accessory protein